MDGLRAADPAQESIWCRRSPEIARHVERRRYLQLTRCAREFRRAASRGSLFDPVIFGADARPGRVGHGSAVDGGMAASD